MPVKLMYTISCSAKLQSCNEVYAQVQACRASTEVVARLTLQWDNPQRQAQLNYCIYVRTDRSK